MFRWGYHEDHPSCTVSRFQLHDFLFILGNGNLLIRCTRRYFINENFPGGRVEEYKPRNEYYWLRCYFRFTHPTRFKIRFFSSCFLHDRKRLVSARKVVRVSKQTNKKMPPPPKPPPPLKLVLTTNSLRNTTISDETDQIYYEIRTESWIPLHTKVKRLDPETREFSVRAEIQRFGDYPAVRVLERSKEWAPADKFLRIDEAKPGGFGSKGGYV